MARNFNGEAGFADAAWSGQGQEADAGAPQQVRYFGCFPFPSDERREWNRQGAGMGRVR